jgi:hypothetical protein
MQKKVRIVPFVKGDGRLRPMFALMDTSTLKYIAADGESLLPTLQAANAFRAIRYELAEFGAKKLGYAVDTSGELKILPYLHDGANVADCVLYEGLFNVTIQVDGQKKRFYVPADIDTVRMYNIENFGFVLCEEVQLDRVTVPTGHLWEADKLWPSNYHVRSDVLGLTW